MAKSNKPKKQQETKKEFETNAAGKRALTPEEIADLCKEKSSEETNQNKVDNLNTFTELGVKSISLERWREAQYAERACHSTDLNNNPGHYADTYKTYFKYLGLGTDLEGLHVIEIGPAMHPALAICKNYGQSIIIEPMGTAVLEEFCKQNSIKFISQPVETLSYIEEIDDMENVLEVWLFNVMQHVIDPEKVVARCKDIADRIRFFEPINTPVEAHHPHSFTGDDYVRWFGDSVQFYRGGCEPGFHTADCAYGVWVNQ